MGKTTTAVALLHDSRIDKAFERRIFQSCEALTEADALVGKLAELVGVSLNSPMLQAAVVGKLTTGPRTILVLDNIETIWLVRDDAAAAAVEQLLGLFAQIPSLSLVITCRGTTLPQSVAWSNSQSAILEPPSLEAALKTFEARAGRQMTADETIVAIALLNLVDRMPLAVTLLGQLSRLGNPVSKLLDRWHREHSALLRTRGTGRTTSVEVSIEISIQLLRLADGWEEALKLLSICSMLPDGLQEGVLERLRPLFKYIDHAQDTLVAYALVSVSPQGVIQTLTPVRHFALEHYPMDPDLREALYSIYFELADQLCLNEGEIYAKSADAFMTEMGNLQHLLLLRVHQPSSEVVRAITRFTYAVYWKQSTVFLTQALLANLDQHPKWKAECLMAIGYTLTNTLNHRQAIIALTDAAQLFRELGDRLSVAWCEVLAGTTHRALGDDKNAEILFMRSCETYAEMGERKRAITCRMVLRDLLRKQGTFPTAMEYLLAMKEPYNCIGNQLGVAQISEDPGVAYFKQGNLDSAAVELETTRSVFDRLQNVRHMLQSAKYLAEVRLKQDDFDTAEQLLLYAMQLSENRHFQLSHAGCLRLMGHLKCVQGNREAAFLFFNSALRTYVKLPVWMVDSTDDCMKSVENLCSGLASS